MASDVSEFVRWREEFVSQERGSRVVHYYLEDAAGASHLAVVGTERSLRHMLYVVSEDFRRAQGWDDGSGFFSRKWRSRREVVDWLASFLPTKTLPSKSPKFGQRIGDDIGIDGFNDSGAYLCHNLGKACDSDIMWSGSFWTCGKQLRHYQAFCRNGTTISTHSFVLVMSEEENRYLAYLEDMYEDKKGQKKVKVRWFHQNQEFACTIPPPAPHPCEVFITPYSQVISVECVDDIATVLTPDHYERCLDVLPSSSLVGIRLCFRQYSKNKFKHFDLRTLRGYFSQAVVLSLKKLSEQDKDGSDIMQIVNHCTPGRIKFSKKHERPFSKCLGTKICRPLKNFIPSYQKHGNKENPRKHLCVKFLGPRNQLAPPYNVGDRIELLSQDSGIRGCWFKCSVIKSSSKKLKVRYDDLQDADDCGSLEEWVPAFRLAAPDKLGVRCAGRHTIRPSPPQNNLVDAAAISPGSAVDVWWNDGWWEGVVVSVSSCVADNLQVYFPGEDIFLACQLENVRISRDWVKNKWVDIEMKSDILSRISSVGDRTRVSDCQISTKGTDSGSSAMSNQELAATQANSAEEEKQTEADKQTEASLSNQELAAAQANSAEEEKQTEADKQTEASLMGGTSTLVEDEKPSVLGKRPRDGEADQGCDGEVGVAKQTEASLTGGTSTFTEDEKQVLGKRPRAGDAAPVSDGEVGVDVGNS